MDAFWAKGYEATSMAELCTCTCLHKGSLYQAFGDKHALFMDALKHYADSEFHETTAVLRESSTPLEQLEMNRGATEVAPKGRPVSPSSLSVGSSTPRRGEKSSRPGLGAGGRCAPAGPGTWFCSPW